MAGEFGACSVEECKKFLCFRGVGALAGDDWAAVEKNAVTLAKVEAEKTGVKVRLEAGEDGERGELHFRVARDV